MRIKNLTSLFMSLLVLVMAGCGGGGGGGAASGTTVSGVASKGPIAGGTVKVYEIISSATLHPRAGIPRYGSTVLAQGATGADGSYSLSLPAGFSKGGVMVQVTGGSYTDESTGTGKRLDDQYGAGGMRAIYSNISGMVRRGEKLSASVTPYTEMAAAYADLNHDLTDASISASNRKVAAAFNLPDIVATKPADPNSAFPAQTSDDAKKYALALATLSQYQNTYGAGASMSTVAAALAGQLAAGLTPQTSTAMGASANIYASGSHNPNPSLDTPAGNPNAPAAIHTSPSTALSTPIGSSVAISAHVVKSDGSVVPDGTMVNFATNFGSLSAASVATANGLANVTLTSAAVGTALVTASSGAVSDSVATINFVDPNAPASLVISAGASRGVTTGAPVVISANVVRAAGGPVPDGTVVNFAVISGSGALSGATTTLAGIATVNLASSAAGASVGVRATAGGVADQLSVPFIAQPTQAIVKVSTSGSLAAGVLIGAIDTTVGFSTNVGLSILPANVVASGVSNVGPTVNTNNAGQARFAFTTTSGIPLGEFATLTFSIAPGNFPTSQDFGIASTPITKVLDTQVNTLNGVSVGISSVTIQ